MVRVTTYSLFLLLFLFLQYADPVADLLDKYGSFRARLFRESCVFHRGNYVKVDKGNSKIFYCFALPFCRQTFEYVLVKCFIFQLACYPGGQGLSFLSSCPAYKKGDLCNVFSLFSIVHVRAMTRYINIMTPFLYTSFMCNSIICSKTQTAFESCLS